MIVGASIANLFVSASPIRSFILTSSVLLVGSSMLSVWSNRDNHTMDVDAAVSGRSQLLRKKGTDHVTTPTIISTTRS